MNVHARILNYLIFRHNYKTYLEIGLDDPTYNFVEIMAPHKEACDPYNSDERPDSNIEITPLINKYLTYHMTSDELFNTLDENKKYDLIFIDGLHEGNQVVKDIVGALKHLNENGLIVVHDCLPAKEHYAQYPYDENTKERHYPNNVIDKTWNGSTWKALPTIEKLGIKFETLDIEFGLGLIRYQKGDWEPTTVDENLTWNSIFKDKEVRNKTLHVIDEETFLNTY